ncbi:hypothetical protein yberc0001_15650 [Yersinia bercovieri ATCC 43970]|uniref:Uncharacterized protein n=1 Tax=Yersinia bercovieri ATCC 43970 TaxID=349968 RepID=A0ABM9XXH9_YERBE|nr:hypothetical protein yberc0001_15650 [Yersinia bercovieri ATCC 43970]
MVTPHLLLLFAAMAVTHSPYSPLLLPDSRHNKLPQLITFQ